MITKDMKHYTLCWEKERCRDVLVVGKYSSWSGWGRKCQLKWTIIRVTLFLMRWLKWEIRRHILLFLLWDILLNMNLLILSCLVIMSILWSIMMIMIGFWLILLIGCRSCRRSGMSLISIVSNWSVSTSSMRRKTNMRRESLLWANRNTWQC